MATAVSAIRASSVIDRAAAIIGRATAVVAVARTVVVVIVTTALRGSDCADGTDDGAKGREAGGIATTTVMATLKLMIAIQPMRISPMAKPPLGSMFSGNTRGSTPQMSWTMFRRTYPAAIAAMNAMKICPRDISGR
jgi:hypothetical protein